MTYISYEYYHETMPDSEIPTSEFYRLAEIASEVVYDYCTLKPDEQDIVSDSFKKAVAYEVEMLHEQGGVDVLFGYSEADLMANNESLGDYSISGRGNETGSQQSIATINGIPVSPMTIMILKRMGLTTKWAYARREDYRE